MTLYEKVMVFGSWENWREKHRRDFTIFLLGNKWRELERFKKNGKKGIFVHKIWSPGQPPHLWGTCATHGQRAGWAVWHTASTRGSQALAFGHQISPAHLSRSSAVFGHPNSDFESVFGLRIVTPSRTTMTMKLWQMVENSAQKTTTNTTQRMRTKRSIATTYELET